jgi:hypothetical protein
LEYTEKHKLRTLENKHSVKSISAEKNIKQQEDGENYTTALKFVTFNKSFEGEI